MSYQHNNPIVLKIQTAADKDIELNRTGRVSGLLGVAFTEIESVSGKLKEAHELGTIPDDVLTTLNALVQQVSICRGIYLSRVNERRGEEDARMDAQVSANKGTGEPVRRTRKLDLDDTPPATGGSALDDLTHKMVRRLEID